MSLFGRTRFGALEILTPPGVYAPRSDTALLAGEIGVVEGAEVLELCTGSGALALTAALRGARRVVAGDRSLRAILTVRLNARRNGLQLEARHGDLFSIARADEHFDLILANPPYLPSAASEPQDERWDAGHDGRRVLDRIIDGVSALLKPAGRVVLVHSALAGVEATRERLAKNNLVIARSVEHEGPLGPIAGARRGYLARIGALEHCSERETLIVLTARRIDSESHDADPALSDHYAGVT